MLSSYGAIFKTDQEIEEELKRVRSAIWVSYDKLKEASFTQIGKEVVHQMYDNLLLMKTMSQAINAVIVNFAT